MAALRRKVVVLISCYNGRAFLEDCLTSLLASAEENIDQHIVVVDDASIDDSVAYVRENFPTVECIRLEQNRGFAGVNNFGWSHVQRHHPDLDYLVLLNMDTRVEPRWLAPLVAHLEMNPRVGAVQPKLLLEDGRINTAGNRSHYLGFGMMSCFGEPDDGRADQPTPIDFPSGAAMMVRASLLDARTLFDEKFYMYLEDADLAWNLRLRGHEVHFVPASRVIHKYIAAAPLKYYEQLERNRWILLLTCYRWQTLMLLAPALLLMELGQLVYAVSVSRLRQKLRSYRWFLQRKNLRHLRARRRRAQRARGVSDRVFTARYVGTVHLPTGDPLALRYLANPLFEAYWWLARRLLRW